MKKQAFVFLFLLFLFQNGWAQTFSKKIVFFTDKNNTPFSLTNPSPYLSTKAIQKRNRYNIVTDSTDLPVLQMYIDSIVQAGTVKLIGRSKWLNAVIIETVDANALTKINSFPFVKKLDNIALRTSFAAPKNKFESLTVLQQTNTSQRLFADTFLYGSTANQIKIHKGEFLHNIGARGQGMTMAFFDAGFTGFQTNRFFDSARARNQFLGTWDFVSNNSNVNEDHPHGLNCFSIVGGYIPGTFVGSSPESGYYLLRTEDAPTEQVIEEYFWALAAEYADSAGVDVISSSLGYSTFDNPIFNHTYNDMNGNTTVITRMADLASKKGILVVSSAGNEGNSSWNFITAPADGDSVFTIGAVNNSGAIANFSSFGPTSNGRIKPDVVSVGQGTALISTSGNVTSSSGTSFSCPNMAGLTTCLWQLFPEFNNWKIITTLRQSADRFIVPHPQYGYGLPNMKKAFGILIGEISTMSASVNNFTATLNWSSKDISSMRYAIERKLPNETAYSIVQTVPANGNVVALRNYNYNDVITNSPAGTVSYRIRQVIDTSTAGFDAYLIDSANVILTTPTSLNDRTANSKLIQLYPNPANTTLILKFQEQSASDFIIQIYNQQGQLISKQNFSKSTGAVQKELNISFLPKGSYFISVLKEGKVYSTKEFVKE
jgi:serine protease AprX